MKKESQLTEWLLRAFAVLFMASAVLNIASVWWANPSRLTVLVFLVIEGYTLILVLFARRASVRDTSALAMVATAYAVLFMILIDARDTVGLVHESVGVALQFVGAAWQVWSKVTLGRSFGLLPAQRGLVTEGPYRLVRHPIYLGYLISHVGFLMANFSITNLAVLVVLYVAQAVRMQREESVLSSSGAYGDYRRIVRWRLVPFVY